MDESLLKKPEKPPNPREKANPLSAVTFSWVLGLFWVGYKRELEVTDIYSPLKDHSAHRLGNKFESNWNLELAKCSKNNHNMKKVPSLVRVIAKVLGAEIMLYGILLAAIEVFVKPSQPLFLGRLIRYFSQKQLNNSALNFDNETSYTNSSTIENNSIVTLGEAFGCALGVIFCAASNAVVEHPYIMAVLHMGMKIHIGCVSLIYRKVLRLSKTALGETTVGEIVNLLSNDVSRFDYSILFLHYLWVGPLQTVVITYFLWKEIGVAAIFGVFTLLATIPLQVWFAKKNSVLRLKTALKTDKRLRLMNEIINGVQVIKMYTWEKPFAKLVSLARRKEVDVVRKISYIRSILLSLFLFHTRIAVFISILFYILQGNYINAEKVFVVICYYNMLQTSMTLFFPQGISLLAEAMVSVRRLQNFMMYGETNESFSKQKKNESEDFEAKMNGFSNESKNLIKEKEKEIEENEFDYDSKYSITMSDVTARWSLDSVDDTLNGISIDILKGKLTTIIGLVGCGKSSLLHIILRELPIKSGVLKVNGTVSYASQEPWLFGGSVRQNILFGQPYERDRYRDVTQVCALRTDFAQMPYGDKTIVSDRGISLSGGQRARINLARAIYKRADIYLLDDPLSAVDTHVGKHLFEDCIMGYLQNKTRILVTHQIQYLNNLDHIIMLENGRVICNGSYETLLSTVKYFSDLLMVSQNETDSDDDAIFLHKKHSSLQSVASSYEDKVQEEPAEVAEMRSVGTLGFKMYKEYFKASGSGLLLFYCFMLCLMTQLLTSYSDYWITFWVNMEEKTFSVDNKPSNYINDQNNISFEVYKNDSKRNSFTVSFDIFDDIINLSLTLNRQSCICIFTILTIATAAVTLVRTFLMFGVCFNASMNLHNHMFNSITRATMKFFNDNSSGRILNRFSKDMGSIDDLLPNVVIDCISISLTVTGIVCIVAFVNPWLLLPTFLITVLFYYMRQFYLTTSRSIKRLEGVTRSPVLSHLSASLQGLATIRAFKAERILEKEFDTHKDLHTSVWYMFIATNHAFGFWLDIFCVVYISLVTFSFLIFDTGVYGGSVGLAITQSLLLTGLFQWFMRQTAELENLMTCVERVLEYTNLVGETPLVSPPDKKPPKSWPSEGKIVFSNVYLRYNICDPPVLKDLSFTVEPGEKIGIVGRTGAGKSSLISALYHLTDLRGEIYIDDIATSTIGLHELRSKISIIPQEPVLFSGTMRKNLDPFDEFSDSILWNALEEVELKEAVSELTDGLDAKMSEGGSNFSVGQRQLVCLARAIVRNNKILVLDEATANVDPQTDTLIQSTIRRKFAECTMLTIAHRLHTVIDSDKVLVMENGMLVEFDHAHVLLQDEDGYFYKMVEQTGKTAETLHKMAADNYRKYIDED